MRPIVTHSVPGHIIISKAGFSLLCLVSILHQAKNCETMGLILWQFTKHCIESSASIWNGTEHLLYCQVKF